MHLPRIQEAPEPLSCEELRHTDHGHVGAAHSAHSTMNSQGQNHSGVIKNINVAYQAAGEKIIRQPDEREMQELAITPSQSQAPQGWSPHRTLLFNLARQGQH